MIKKIARLIYFCGTTLLIACGTEGVGADAIDRAEAAVNAGDMTGAQHSADSIIKYHGNNLDVFTPSQLCRLAVVYKKLADNTLTTEESNTETALKLYQKAFSISADSVIIYRRSLTLDDAATFEVLSTLQAMKDAPIDLEKIEPIDTAASVVNPE